MQKKAQNESRGKTERIEVRLSASLKQAIEEYSIRNLESIMVTTNRAIKEYVGFGQQEPSVPEISENIELPKNDRLEIRIHPQLKTMLLDIQQKISIQKGTKPNISTMVLSAIIQYIAYKN